MKIPGIDHPVTTVWSYGAPYPAISAIQRYLAFYPDRVDAIEDRIESIRIASTASERSRRDNREADEMSRRGGGSGKALVLQRFLHRGALPHAVHERIEIGMG